MSVLDKFHLDGKRALITGGSRGLGRAIAQAFAEAGADLVLVGTNAHNLEQAQAELSPLRRRVDLLVADLSSTEETQWMCERVLSDFGLIQILVNNVGGRRENIPLESTPLEEW